MRDQTENPKKKYSIEYILFFIGIVLYFLFFIVKKLEFFKTSKSFEILISLLILICIGYHVILHGFAQVYQNTIKNKKFTPNVDILMFAGALGAVYVDQSQEAILLIFIFVVAHFLEDFIENKNTISIKKLLQGTSQQARLLQTDGSLKLVETTELKIDDQVVVLNGDLIPSDGIVIKGYSNVDESNITGESLSLDKKPGDQVFGNTINLTDTLTIKITSHNNNTIFAKIIKLTEEAQKNISPKATCIKKIEPIYVKIIIAIVFLLLLLSFLNYCFFDIKYLYFKDNILRKSIIFLTVASPCALVVADIPATLSAISHLARKGILFKSGRTLNLFSFMKAIVLDKTGTLTTGHISVQDILYNKDFTEEEKLKYFNILFQIEQNANHPLSFAIQKYLSPYCNSVYYSELHLSHLPGIGIEASDKDGDRYKIGNPNSFIQLSDKIKVQTEELTEKGYTVVYFSHNDEVIFVIVLLDSLRKEALEMVHYLKKRKIKTFMLTGDNEKTAKNIADQLHLDFYVANCLPKDKVFYFHKIQKKYDVVAVAGDGINDAPILTSADIAITLQCSTDIAIDIADVILMQNDLKKIIYTYKVSRKLNIVIWQNIIFAIIVIFILSIFNFVGDFLNMPLAAFIHETSTILVLFNSLRLLSEVKK